MKPYRNLIVSSNIITSKFNQSELQSFLCLSVYQKSISAFIQLRAHPFPSLSHPLHPYPTLSLPVPHFASLSHPLHPYPTLCIPIPPFASRSHPLHPYPTLCIPVRATRMMKQMETRGRCRLGVIHSTSAFVRSPCPVSLLTSAPSHLSAFGILPYAPLFHSTQAL